MQQHPIEQEEKDYDEFDLESLERSKALLELPLKASEDNLAEGIRRIEDNEEEIRKLQARIENIQIHIRTDRLLNLSRSNQINKLEDKISERTAQIEQWKEWEQKILQAEQAERELAEIRAELERKEAETLQRLERLKKSVPPNFARFSITPKRSLVPIEIPNSNEPCSSRSTTNGHLKEGSNSIKNEPENQQCSNISDNEHYSCAVCSKQFQKQSLLTIHLSKVHNIHFEPGQTKSRKRFRNSSSNA